MLSAKLKELRTAYGLNQVELGKRLTVTKQTVSNWENNNIQPSVDMLIKIADLFSVSTDYLLEREGNVTIDVEGLLPAEIAHVTHCLILVCIRTRKNACPSRQALNLFDCLQSNCAGNLTGAQAACASVHSFRRAVYDCFHSFHIGFPCSVGTSVRVRNLDAESNIFTAEFTLSHFVAPPFFQ